MKTSKRLLLTLAITCLANVVQAESLSEWSAHFMGQSTSSDSCLGADSVNAADFAEPDSTAELNDTFEFPAEKRKFKRRVAPYNNYIAAINIEANFSAPIVGNDNYFGTIYLTGSTTEVRYRDELVANRRYKLETENPSVFYSSSYSVASINSPVGLSLIKQAGAEVNIKATNFTTSKGGRINLKVKAPGESAMNLVIDIEVKGRKVQNYLIVDGKKYAFDSLKINAEKAMLTGTSILNGIEELVFSQNGKVSYTFKQ